MLYFRLCTLSESPTQINRTSGKLRDFLIIEKIFKVGEKATFAILSFEEIVSVTLSYPPCKDSNARFTRVPLKAFSDFKVWHEADVFLTHKKTDVFLTWKDENFLNFSFASYKQGMRNSLQQKMKINSLKKQPH